MKMSYDLPLKDGCRRGLTHRWPFHAGYAQCGRRTSYDTPELLFRPAGFCNVHEQPVLIKQYE